MTSNSFPLRFAWLALVSLATILPSAADDRSAHPTLEVPQCRVVFVDRRLVSAGSTGVIAEIAEEGSRIASGSVLVQFEDRVPRAALAAATARAESDVEVRLAEKAVEAANVELEAAILANSLAPEAYARVELERLRVTRDQADLEIERARQQLKIAQRERDLAAAELAATQTLAPISGLVTKQLKNVGAGVQTGEPLLELVNTGRVRIEGYVPLEQVWRLQVGQPVRVQLDLSGVDLPVEQEVFEGQLGFIDVSVQAVAGTARVWAEVANRNELLKDGLNAHMTIQFP
ncbi:MAG: efflux RND transporter periplasmic adaptor subunit [Planctomycetaceae bacterium]|nr:efflux RND transporter periplasmic adaptor subunit [Planctomycetaceae bacterium]